MKIFIHQRMVETNNNELTNSANKQQ